MRLVYYSTAGLAYGIIVITHFNVKMWMSVINPTLWDNLYWKTDQMVRPLIDASFVVHNFVEMTLPMGEHLYLFAFLAMFAGSIIVHSMRASSCSAKSFFPRCWFELNKCRVRVQTAGDKDSRIAGCAPAGLPCQIG